MKDLRKEILREKIRLEMRKERLSKEITQREQEILELKSDPKKTKVWNK